MQYQSTFKRYELKYMLTNEQKMRLLSVMTPYMALDGYGRTLIKNIYFDTDDYRLIRRSIEKPTYKEKIRVRRYGEGGSTGVFAELKKKYDGVVFKRRVQLAESDAMEWISGVEHPKIDTQISREIDYFLGFYGLLRPKVLLSYEREAYYCLAGGDFRVTFDDNILARTDGLSLSLGVGGAPLLSEGLVLMELKCSGAIPLFMARALSWEGLFKTSFSKYGTAYREIIFPNKNNSIWEEYTNVG